MSSAQPNPLDELVQGAADELWASTEPLTDEQVAALVRRQREIRRRLGGGGNGE